MIRTNCYGAEIYSYLPGSDLVTRFKIFLFFISGKKKHCDIRQFNLLTLSDLRKLPALDDSKKMNQISIQY